MEKKTKRFDPPIEQCADELGGQAPAVRKELIDSCRISKESESGLLPAEPTGSEAKALAMNEGIQRLWGTLLPLIGVLPAEVGEYPGLFRVEPGPTEHEATIFIDIPHAIYESGRTPKMDRVVTLRVKLDHDYRLLGDHYYCVDCEAPTNETRH